MGAPHGAHGAHFSHSTAGDATGAAVAAPSPAAPLSSLPTPWPAIAVPVPLSSVPIQHLLHQQRRILHGDHLHSHEPTQPLPHHAHVTKIWSDKFARMTVPISGLNAGVIPTPAPGALTFDDLGLTEEVFYFDQG